MNSMKCERIGNVDTTNGTKLAETSIECGITGRKRARRCLPSPWYRICEKCGDKIYYSSKGNLNSSIRAKRTTCQSCSVVQYPADVIYSRECPKCGKRLVYKCWTTFNRQNRANKLCRSCWQKREYDGPYERKCPTCNKSIWHTDKRRRDRSAETGAQCLSCSISKKNRVRHQRIREMYGNVSVPAFNRKACAYFDELNAHCGWNLIHALNGGEHHLHKLGYWLDAYDESNNIVVEYDEKHHFTKSGNLKKKDIDRMNEICQYLGCRFYRYNEKLKKLTEYEYQSRKMPGSCNPTREKSVG